MAQTDAGVDILIPFHGQYALLKSLVLSIVQHTLDGPYRITAIDDASANSNFFDEISKFDYLDAIRLPEHRGFAAAVNAGIKHTKKPYIVLINSDCEIRETSWLTELWEGYNQLSRSHNVRLLSSCMDKITNGQKEQEQPRLIRSPSDKIVDGPLSLTCCFFPRKLIQKIGMLKEYPYGYYEDEEFFYRMRASGYKQAVVGKSWVHHEGGATVRYLWDKKPETKEVMLESNREKCIADIIKLK